MAWPTVQTLIACGSAVVLAAACASPPPTISVQKSDAGLISQGETYAWEPVQEHKRASADPRVSNEAFQTRLRTAVDDALTAKGFRQVSNPADAQLIASYHVGLKNLSEGQVDAFNTTGPGSCGFNGCVGGWGLYGPPQIDISNIDYVEGSMILDLTDRKTGKLAWRASSTKRVDDSAAGGQAQLNALVSDMTKSLPGPVAVAKK